jgi:ribosomal protein S18 acetylase RimI-like enzyme
MGITYRDTRDIDQDVLQDLFLALEWDSGNHPDKLARAMAASASVFTAWDGDRLIGLVSVLSDGFMAAYIHYVLVRPEYQGQGIGQRLLSMVDRTYGDVMTKVLVSNGTAVGFYERCGFRPAHDKTPMFLTSLAV